MKKSTFAVLFGVLLVLIILTGTTTAQTLAGSMTYRGLHDFATAFLRIPSSNSLPGTCVDGEVYQDNDATSGSNFRTCVGGSWVLPGGGAATTAAALAANGTNCTEGNYARGVDAAGNAENCTAVGGGGSATAGPWVPYGYVGTGTNYVNTSANRVNIYPITLLAPVSIQRAKWYVATGTASTGECGMAIYSASTGSKLHEFDAACTANSTAVSSSLGSAQTLNPGVYYIAHSSNDTTIAVTFLSISSVLNAIINLNGTEIARIGYCTNTADFSQSSGSIFPASCGALNEGAFASVPMVIFEPTSI